MGWQQFAGTHTRLSRLVDTLLASTDAQMSAHDVAVETALDFQDLLVHCTWHNHLIPGIINAHTIGSRILHSRGSCRTCPQPTLDSLVAHYALAIVPHLQWSPHGVPEHVHGRLLPHASLVRSCPLCAHFQHRVLSLVQQAGRSGSAPLSATHALAKRLVQKPFPYVILDNGRPESAVCEEARAVGELAGTCDIQRASGAGHEVGWAGAIWTVIASVGGILTRAG